MQSCKITEPSCLTRLERVHVRKGHWPSLRCSHVYSRWSNLLAGSSQISTISVKAKMWNFQHLLVWNYRILMSMDLEWDLQLYYMGVISRCLTRISTFKYQNCLLSWVHYWLCLPGWMSYLWWVQQWLPIISFPTAQCQQQGQHSWSLYVTNLLCISLFISSSGPHGTPEGREQTYHAAREDTVLFSQPPQQNCNL